VTAVPEPVVALGLFEGPGIRFRSGASDTDPARRRSSALLPVAGRSVLERQVSNLAEQGVGELLIVARGWRSTAQARTALGDGSRFGVRIRYSEPLPAAAEPTSTELVAHALAHWRLDGPTVVFAAEALHRFDLAALLRAHRERGSTATVAVVRRHPADLPSRARVLRMATATAVAGVSGPAGRPEPGVHRSDAAVLIDAGLMLLDAAEVGRLCRTADPAGAPGRSEADLLSWLIGRQGRVAAEPIPAVGVLHTPRDYLETMRRVMRGGFGSVVRGLRGYVEMPGRRWVHESTLRRRDDMSGRTLEQKLTDGSVHLGPNVWLGQDVRVRPGVRIVDSDVGDHVSLDEGSILEGVAAGDGSSVGPHARLRDCCLGNGAQVRSSARLLTSVGSFTLLGDRVVVEAGARLKAVSIHPGLVVPADVYLPEGTEVPDLETLHGMRRRVGWVPWPY
jgi:NDP-sugar pyrophosphorylase family protein